ncbi:MAG: hypothetical protein ACXW2P_07890 [Thermoanaerobaculia bacterium]
MASLVLAGVTLVGTSAFAESRPSNETRSRGDARSTVRRSGTPARSQVTVEGRRGDGSRNRSVEKRQPRSIETRQEGRTNERRNEGRTYERRDNRNGTEGRTYERRADRNNDSRSRNSDRYRNNDSRNRNGDYRNNDSRNRDRGSDRYRNDGRDRNDHRYSDRQPYHARGRVSRYQRYGGGYRVWVHGAPYPFYVPLSYWRHDRFRVGLFVSLGGYYNPLGYYDYWDGYRDGVYNSGYRAQSEADFRGVVESVDPRRDTFVVRNDDTGNFITVVMRDRREALPRPGDYVAVRGDWTTRGTFHAYDLDFLEYERY